jgi:hypothetical protein
MATKQPKPSVFFVPEMIDAKAKQTIKELTQALAQAQDAARCCHGGAATYAIQFQHAAEMNASLAEQLAVMEQRIKELEAEREYN